MSLFEFFKQVWFLMVAFKEETVINNKKEKFVEPNLEEGRKTRCYFNPEKGVWFIKYQTKDGEILNHSTGTDELL